MDRVAAQQGRALHNVILALLAHHDGTQTHAAVGSLAGNEDAGEQATDAPEAVQDNVASLQLRGGPDDLGELLFQELAQILAIRAGVILCQAAQVDRRGAQVHLDQFLQDGQRVIKWQFALNDAARVAVRLDDIDVRGPQEQAAVDRRDRVVLAVQLADQREHLLREGELVVPVSGGGS